MLQGALHGFKGEPKKTWDAKIALTVFGSCGVFALFLTNLHSSRVVKDVKRLREGGWAESLPQCYKTFRVTTRIERFEQMVIALWSQIFKWPNLILHRPANNRFDATDHSKFFEQVMWHPFRCLIPFSQTLSSSWPNSALHFWSMVLARISKPSFNLM